MKEKSRGIKGAEKKPLSLKIKKDVWERWKILAIKEDTTMSEIAERLITDYLKRKGA